MRSPRASPEPVLGRLKAEPGNANGNLTSDGVWTYTYDVENRLLTASDGSTSVNYTYDPLGRRVSKDVNGSVTLYLSDGVSPFAPDGASARHSASLFQAF